MKDMNNGETNEKPFQNREVKTESSKLISISELKSLLIDSSNSVVDSKYWGTEERGSLIESVVGIVFSHAKTAIEIVQTEDGQLIDGGKMLVSICDFLDDKFTFQGKLFSEWGIEQQILFKTYKVVFVTIPSLEQPDRRMSLDCSEIVPVFINVKSSR